MVNLGFNNVVALLGLLDILGSIAYLILTLSQILQGTYDSPSTSSTALQAIELWVSPLVLLLSGVILFFNGWRLDPILQLQQLLFHLIVGASFIKMASQLLNLRR